MKTAIINIILFALLGAILGLMEVETADFFVIWTIVVSITINNYFGSEE